MQLKKSILFSGGCLLAAVSISLFNAPKLSAAIKAVFVESVLPSKPFFTRIPAGLNRDFAVGPDQNGTLGVTSIMLTNFSNESEAVDIYQPVMAPNEMGCSLIKANGGPDSIFFVARVPAAQTITLPFPSPLVFSPVDGHSCIAFRAAPDLDMYVTGFVN